MSDLPNSFFAADLSNGRRLQFRSFEELEQWFDVERQFWAWLRNARGEIAGSQVVQFRNEFWQQLGAIGQRIQEWKTNPENTKASQLLLNAIQNAYNILLRIFLSERHLATDAEERVTMVKTYLALANEAKVEPADRALVLGPLFRSAADGIVRDEGPDASIAGIIARALDIKSKG